MLMDGGVQQLKDIKTCIEYYQVAVTLILDFIHVLEYLWKAAFCFHAEGSEEAEACGCRTRIADLEGQGERCGGWDAPQCDLTAAFD